MKIDVAVIASVRDELCRVVAGAKIDKISQPQKDTVILTLRCIEGGEKTRRLLISAGTGDARVHLTQYDFENPAAPPMFCMLLRKHLLGARIESVTQPPGERMLIFELKTSTALGDAVTMKLLIELFGRIPNIILTDSGGIIIDCLRRIGGDGDGRRMILPGLRYQFPSPAPCRNIPHPGDMQQEQANSADGNSISETLDAAYTRRAALNAMKSRSSAMLKTMRTAQKRITRRLETQRSELQESGNKEYLRQCADIIMANLHKIKKGDDVLIADDFYSNDGAKRELKLDPLLTGQKNAAKYYKLYAKARNAAQHLSAQITAGETELSYVHSVIEQLERAQGIQVLDEIYDELARTGYIKPKKEKKKQKKPESKFMEFTSSSGMLIMAGKNNTQNDRLTFNAASRSDIWLHAQKIHGAHVIIRQDGGAADNETLREAAAIAAHYSAARSAGRVPVDYTLIKYVKKPPGARPGMVIYTDYKTIIVKPDEELVNKLVSS